MIETLAYVSAVGSALIAARGLQNIGHFTKNVRLFERAQPTRGRQTPQRHYYMIIPALREQAVLEATMDYFAGLDFEKQHFTIVIATTHREAFEHARNKARLPELARDIAHAAPLGRILATYAGVFDRATLSNMHAEYGNLQEKETLKVLQKSHAAYVSTDQLAHTIADRLNKQAGRKDFIMVIEYPDEKGHMVHQIDYVISKLQSVLQPQDYVAIYNADSRPAKNTLRVAEKMAQEHVADGKQAPEIMQQSSLFTLNVPEVTQHYNAAWRANAYHQSMWTLKHDITMRRLQSKHVIQLQGDKPSVWKRLFHTRFAVCTGHGLFINAAHYNVLPLPQDVIVEDAAYGIMQCLNHVPITQLYTLENSESPTSLRSVINQKRVWFRLVFDLMRIQRNAYRMRQKTGTSALEILMLTVRITPIYFLWLFHSFFTTVPFILAIVLHSPVLFGAWLLAMCLYWLLPAIILDSRLSQLVGQKPMGTLQTIRIFILGMPGILTHSIGPWQSMYDEIRRRMGIQVEKKKTER